MENMKQFLTLTGLILIGGLLDIAIISILLLVSTFLLTFGQLIDLSNVTLLQHLIIAVVTKLTLLVVKN